MSIHTEEEHRAALAEIERLWNAEPGTPAYEKFKVLATLVDAYERKHTPIPPPVRRVLSAVRDALEAVADAIKALLPSA